MGWGMVAFLALYGLTGFSLGFDVGLLAAGGLWFGWSWIERLEERDEKSTSSKIP